MNNEQDLLNRLYLEETQAAHAHFSAEALGELSYPFMLNANPEYLDAPTRVMFVGKETNGWLEGRGKLNAFYEDAGTGVEQCVARHRRQYEKESWNTPFLRTLAKVATELQLPSREAVLWNNLLKCDWDRGRSESRVAIGHSETLNALSVRLFRAEVDILRPDFIVFACGAGYDRLIKASLRAIEDSDVHEKRAFWTFRSGGALCIRLRHPGARSSRNFGSATDYYERALRGIATARRSHVVDRHWPPSNHPDWNDCGGNGRGRP